jgi:TRAP-type mannitol/chloroaromatic compound transport system permease large subunit
MPLGFLLVAGRALYRVGPSWRTRLAASLFLAAPLALQWIPPQLQGNAVTWAGAIVLLAGAVLGVPIFATLGGLALLLLRNVGQPAASVPLDLETLVASPILPSLPLYTLAGYFLAEGGASARLLRVFNSLFGWLPGGLAITTAVGCAVLA